MARTRSQAVSPGGHVSLETDRKPRKKTATAPKSAGVEKPSETQTTTAKTAKRGPKKGRKGTGKKKSDESQNGDEMEVEDPSVASSSTSNNNNQSEQNISSSTSKPMEGLSCDWINPNRTPPATQPDPPRENSPTDSDGDLEMTPPPPNPGQSRTSKRRARSASPRSGDSPNYTRSTPGATLRRRARSEEDILLQAAYSALDTSPINLNQDPMETDQTDATSAFPVVTSSHNPVSPSVSAPGHTHISSVTASPFTSSPGSGNPQPEPAEDPMETEQTDFTSTSPVVHSSPNPVSQAVSAPEHTNISPATSSSSSFTSPVNPGAPHSHPAGPSHTSPISPTGQQGQGHPLSPGSQLEAELWQHFDEMDQDDSTSADHTSQPSHSASTSSQSGSNVDVQNIHPVFVPVNPAEAIARNSNFPRRAIEVRRVVVPPSPFLFPTPSRPMEQPEMEDITMEDIVLPEPSEFEVAFPDFVPLTHRRIRELAPEGTIHPYPHPHDVRPREESVRAWLLERYPPHVPSETASQNPPSSPTSESTDGEVFVTPPQSPLVENVTNASNDNLEDQVDISSAATNSHISPPHSSSSDTSEEPIPQVSQPSSLPQVVGQPTLTDSSPVSPLPPPIEGSISQESNNPTSQISYISAAASETPPSQSYISPLATHGDSQDSLHGHSPASFASEEVLSPPVRASEDSQIIAPGPTGLSNSASDSVQVTSMATQTSPSLPRRSLPYTSTGTQTSPSLSSRSLPYTSMATQTQPSPSSSCPHCSTALSCLNCHPTQAAPESSLSQVPPESARSPQPESSPIHAPTESSSLQLLPGSSNQASMVSSLPRPIQFFRQIFSSEGQTQEQQLTQSPVAPRKRARDQSSSQDDDGTVNTRPQKRRATGSIENPTRRNKVVRRNPTHPRSQALARRQPPSNNHLFRRNISYAETRRRVALERQGRVCSSTTFRLPELIAQNNADRLAAAETQASEAPQAEVQPVEQENSTGPGSRYEPVAPAAETSRPRWGIRNLVSRFIPGLGNVRDQPVTEAVHVSPTRTGVSGDHTAAENTVADRNPPETPRQQGDGPARPCSHPVDIGARPETVPPSNEQARMQIPQDLTYSLFSQPIDRSSYLRAADHSRENGEVNAVAGPSYQAHPESDKPQSLKKRKRNSLEEIPNPPGCSYGMDLDYFCYSSESDEEEEVEEDEEQAGKNPPTAKPAAKRVRFEASVPGPQGREEVPVEAEPRSPSPVMPNQYGTYCVEYATSTSSSAGSPTPPPPSAVARGEQPDVSEVAREPQPSLSEPRLLSSPPSARSTMPTASDRRSHHTLPTLSGGQDFGLGRAKRRGSDVAAVPEAWDFESRVWEEEMATDDQFSRDALWMYQQAPSGDLGRLPWPSDDRYANTVGADNEIERLVGEVWSEQHTRACFDHFSRDFESFEAVEEV